MSAQQADLLTSELERYRSLLTPVLRRILDTHLRLWGHTAPLCRRSGRTSACRIQRNWLRPAMTTPVPLYWKNS